METVRDRLWGWAAPLAVTALGGVLRLQDLANPRVLVFDETYYAKDGYSLLLSGYERTAVDKIDEKINTAADPSSLTVFTDDPSFIVHPPIGKWLIAGGESVFGLTPFGWRAAVAIIGTLSILVLARAGRRLTGSTLWGTVAGLFMAIDGMAIVTSRIAILDGMLTFFVICAFAFLLLDRDSSRAKGPSGHWWRPWRLSAAIMLGLACGVKWSGIWFVVAFGLLTVAWDASRRHREGERWIPAWLKDGIPAGITMGSVIALVYVAGWYGWFVGDDAWGRNWAEGGGALNALKSLWHYHSEMLNFHKGLSSPHGYQSSAFGWLVQARPTSFHYTSPQGCDSGVCASAITALGNPIIWWAGVLALLHQLWRWIGHRDWRAAAVLTGLAAGWIPWLLFPDRTIFHFYSIALAPFVFLALALSLAAIANPDPRTGRWVDRRGRIVAVAVFLLVCIGTSWWFYPIWSAAVIDQTQWQLRMWLPSWV